MFRKTRLSVHRLLWVTGPAALAVLLAPLWSGFDLFRHTWPVWCLSGLTVLALALTLRQIRTASVALILSCLIALPAMTQALQGAPHLTTGPEQRTLTLVTHNIFGRGGDAAERMAQTIRQADADIIALQEVWDDGEDVQRALATDYPHVVDCDGGPTRLLLRARPVTTGCLQAWQPRFRLPGLRVNPTVWADFDLDDGTTFRVISTHLPWPSPLNAQARQIDRISALLNETDRSHTIILGDFNAAAPAVIMERMERDWGLTRRTRNLRTWPSFPLEVAGIDHVYAGARWRNTNVGLLPATASDHRPVVATLWLDDQS